MILTIVSADLTFASLGSTVILYEINRNIILCIYNLIITCISVTSAVHMRTIQKGKLAKDKRFKNIDKLAVHLVSFTSLYNHDFIC